MTGRPKIVASLIAIVALTTGSAGAGGNKYEDVEKVVGCDGGTITYEGPEKLWPPNHKLIPIEITATADDPDDEVTLTTEGAHNEIDAEGNEAPGSGNTQTDVDPPTASDSGTGSASVAHGVRAERAGTGDGRTYSIEAVATFGDQQCMTSFGITVPHDQRGGADWKSGSKGKS